MVNMIRVTPTGLTVSVSGPTVYLDNCGLYDLAESDASRRRRFVNAVHSGIDLLFSVTNAAELSGPQGRSAAVVRDFLDEIGPHWFPVRLDATEIVRREMAGENPGEACIDKNFFTAYAADLIRPYSVGSGRVLNLSEGFFSLGPLMERLSRQRDSISRSSAEFDDVVKEKMIAIRDKCRRDPSFLSQKLPVLSFDPARPAFFVYRNLLRVMALEADSLKKGDGMDFFHAVVACAFGVFAVLDTKWARRARSLPANRLARVYSPVELDHLVVDMEALLSQPAADPPLVSRSRRAVARPNAHV